MPRLPVLVLCCASLAAACGGASPTARVASTPSGDASPRDVPNAQAFLGPFASWDEICGPVTPLEGVENTDAESPVRHERCSVHETVLAEAGPFLAMATFFEGSAMAGNAYLGLKTERGWFVQEVPDGRAFPGFSHHSPSSASFDPAATRFVDGLLRVVSRGSSSSFIPGQGPLGSSSHQWTAVGQCGLRDGAPVCGSPAEVWSERCQVSMGDEGPRSSIGAPVGERTCEERGEDIPR